MNPKLLGSILLIVGTSLGGGILALPMVTAELGFTQTILAILIAWGAMTLSAFLILEVNLWHSTKSNLTTMAKTTLGRFGLIITWTSYLLLLYGLLAAYIAGGSDFIQQSFIRLHFMPKNLSTLLFTGLLSLVVSKGIHSVDYVNRRLVTSKIVTYTLLVLAILPFASSFQLSSEKTPSLNSIIESMTVLLTSFGFAIIVPSLRYYLQGNLKELQKAILIGSLIPLFCYVVWIFLIRCVIPLQGSSGLIHMANSAALPSHLIGTLSLLLNSKIITFLAKLFTVVCLATSFLGVALSLFDFLRDGLSLKKSGPNKVILYIATFLPPLIIINRYPNAFVKALSYSGLLCVFLLMLLPALMAWSGRYFKKYPSDYKIVGGKPLLLLLIMFSLIIIILSWLLRA